MCIRDSTLTKQWRGNDPNERPEVRIDLIANFFDNNGIELNQYVDSFYANGSKTSATFENLPIYSPWGTLIEYYALESSVPINYVAEHNGTTVINTCLLYTSPLHSRYLPPYRLSPRLQSQSRCV